MFPALPLSDGGGDEDHEKRSIEETLEDKANEYRGRKPDSHICCSKTGQGARGGEREGIEMCDAVGLSNLYVTEGLP